MVKKTKVKRTIRQAKAIKDVVANGGSMASAMRRVGYSESMARNPQKLTRSVGFAGVLEAAGLDDKWLAAGYKRLGAITEMKRMVIPHTHTENLVELDAEDPKYDKQGGGRQCRTEDVYTPVEDKELKRVFAAIPGAKIILVQKDSRHTIVRYTVPHHQALKSALELSSKAKGAFAPERQEHTFPDLTDDEKDELDAILDKNL